MKKALKLTLAVAVVAVLGSYVAYNAYHWIKPPIPLAPEEVAKLFAKPSERPAEITIYYDSAVVTEYRRVSLSYGVNEVRLSEVPPTLRPETIMVSDETETSAKVLEIEYDYDLVSTSRLFEEHLGKAVTVVTDGGNVTGTLLGYADGIVLDLNGAVVVLKEFNKVVLPGEGAKFEVRPAILCKINASTVGDHVLKLSYMTYGMRWAANYVAVLSEDRIESLNGWATIVNNVGKDFEGAKIMLIAGEVGGVRTTWPQAVAEGTVSEGPGKVFEYEVYPLEGPLTLRRGAEKQVLLMSSRNISFTKEYVADWQRYGREVRVALSFNNSADNNLGLTLPRGGIRVFKEELGKLQLVSQGYVDETQRNQVLRIAAGTAPGIVFDRKQVDYRRVGEGSWVAAYELTVANCKDVGVEVTLVEHAQGDWRIVEASHQPVKVSADAFEFHVLVEPDEVAKVRYSIEVRSERP